MKAWSVIGLLFGAAMFATIPISPQVTTRGLELSVDQAQATFPLAVAKECMVLHRRQQQDDKWSFCLTAGTLCPANQERQ